MTGVPHIVFNTTTNTFRLGPSEQEVSRAFEGTALSRQTSIDRDAWQVGDRVYGLNELTRRVELWTVVSIDWTRPSGPIIADNDQGTMHMFRVHDLRREDSLPRTVEEIERFLAE